MCLATADFYKEIHEVQQEKHQVSQRTFPKSWSEKELGGGACIFCGGGSTILQSGPRVLKAAPLGLAVPSRGSHLASLGLPSLPRPYYRGLLRDIGGPSLSPILAAGPRRASGEARPRGIKALGRAPPPQSKSNSLQPETREPSWAEGVGAVEGDLPGVGGTGARGRGRKLGEAQRKKTRGLMWRLAQPRRRRGDLRGAGVSGGDSQAAPAVRAYPVDLGQPPLLPGFEQAERLPSCRRQRGGPGSGGLPGPRAAGPAVSPARAGGGQGTPRRGAGQGRGTARGRKRLPWNLLLSATDMVSAGLPPARGLAAAARHDEEGEAPGPSSGGVWRRDGGAEGWRGRPDTPLPPSPPHPHRPPRALPPRRQHQSAYYAGRRARRPPLCWRARKMHGAGPPGTSPGPFPVPGRGVPRKKVGTISGRTCWGGRKD